jgi:hypothetical protein
VGGVWKDGSTLVMGKDAVLPPFCVKCNRVVGKPDFKRNLRWHHPALYLLLLPGWLIYLIVAMIIRKRATVYLGLCPDHISQRRIAIAVCWALVLLGLVGIIGGVAYETFEMIGVGGLIITGAAIFSTYGVQPVRVQKMDDHFIWLKRINKDYLARLPELPGRF